MNARRLRLLAKPAEPMPAVPVSDVRRVPLQLTPIPWSKPDPFLARVVLQHIADVTPPTVIPFNPLSEQRVRRALRAWHIVHD